MGWLDWIGPITNVSLPSSLSPLCPALAKIQIYLPAKVKIARQNYTPFNMCSRWYVTAKFSHDTEH